MGEFRSYVRSDVGFDQAGDVLAGPRLTVPLGVLDRLIAKLRAAGHVGDYARRHVPIGATHLSEAGRLLGARDVRHARERSVQHEPIDGIGMARREGHRQEAHHRPSQDCQTVQPGRLHDGLDIPQQRLRAAVGDAPLRGADAARIVLDQLTAVG
jgi:hypothetical protein